LPMPLQYTDQESAFDVPEVNVSVVQTDCETPAIGRERDRPCVSAFRDDRTEAVGLLAGRTSPKDNSSVIVRHGQETVVRGDVDPTDLRFSTLRYWNKAARVHVRGKDAEILAADEDAFVRRIEDNGVRAA